MKRTLWMIIVLLALIVGASIASSVSLRRETDRVTAMAQDGAAQAAAGDWDAALATAQRMQSEWDVHGLRLELFAQHADVDRISQNMAVLVVLARERDRLGYLAETARLTENLAVLPHKDQPRLENVF